MGGSCAAPGEELSASAAAHRGASRKSKRLIDIVSVPNTGVAARRRGFRLLLLEALRPATSEDAVRARLEIAVDVIEVVHDVLDLAEGGHDVLRRGGDVLAAVDDDFVELVLAHGLERFRKRRRVGAARTVRTVATQAGFGIAPPAIVGVLVDLAVLDHIGLLL